MSEISFKLVLNSKVYEVPFDRFLKVKKDIFQKLIFDAKHEYKVKSNVDEKNFEIFLKYLNEEESPNITVENFNQFNQLSQEFEVMKDLIQRAENEFGQEFRYLNQLRESSSENKPIFEKLISKNLDNYLELYGNEIMSLPIQTLYNIFNDRDRKLEKHNLAYQLILAHGKEHEEIYSLLEHLDGFKLSKTNLEDSILKRREHFGFQPNIDFEYLSNKIDEEAKERHELEEKLKNIEIINQRKLESMKTEIEEEIEKHIQEMEKRQSAEVSELKQIIETKNAEIKSIEEKCNEKIAELEQRINELKDKQVIETENIKTEIIKTQESTISTISEGFMNNFSVSPSLTEKGILETLQSKTKNLFERPFIVAQSSNDIYNIIDPNTEDEFGTTNLGNFYIKFELKEPIIINGIKIKSSYQDFPRSFDIEIDDEIVSSVRDEEELNGKFKEKTINIPQKKGKLVCFIQRGPNWDKNNNFLFIKKIELLSPEAKYSEGVFATLLNESPQHDPHKCDVHISSSYFDFNSFYSLDAKHNIWTFDYDNSWFQIELTRGYSIITGFRLTRCNSGKIRSFKIIGSTKSDISEETWTELIKVDEERKNEHEVTDVYMLPQASPPVNFIKLIQTKPNWSNEKSLMFIHFDIFGFYF